MKKGDRIKVYGNLGTQGTLPKRTFDYFTRGHTATHDGVSSDEEIWVKFDFCVSVISGHTALVHKKQCRKIKNERKKRRD